jgi:hypothetical protein
MLKVVRYAKEAGIEVSTLRYIGKGAGRHVFSCIYKDQLRAFKIERITKRFAHFNGKVQFENEQQTDFSNIVNYPIDIDYDYKWGIYDYAHPYTRENFHKWCGRKTGMASFVDTLRLLIATDIVHDIAPFDMDFLPNDLLQKILYMDDDKDPVATNTIKNIQESSKVLDWIKEFIWFTSNFVKPSIDLAKTSSLGFVEDDKGDLELKIIDWGVCEAYKD